MNYSPQARELLEEGRVELDRWKCSDWPELVSGARGMPLPLYLHLDLQAGPGENGSLDLGHIAARLRDTDTPYANLHLAPRRVDYPDIPMESSEQRYFDRVVEGTVSDIEPLAGCFGAENVIVENLPYRGSGNSRLRMGAEAGFMNRVCDLARCGFLLDIAHACTAAHYLGLDEREYLASLPVHRLAELHVSGVDTDESGNLREHMALTESDWSLLSWCLDNVRNGLWRRPWLLAFEYGGIGPIFEWRSRKDVLAEQLPRLREMCVEV